MPDRPMAEFSIWLLARDDQQQRLRDTVLALADQHQGHRFEPHVTVQGDLALAEADARALVQALAAATPPLHWAVQAVERTEHYFRALYLRLAGGAAFDALRQACQARSGTPAGLSPYAHLSLAYGPPGAGAGPGPQAAALDAYRGQVLPFDRVALCRSSQAVPIAEWRLLLQMPLTGPAKPHAA